MQKRKTASSVYSREFQIAQVFVFIINFFLTQNPTKSVRILWGLPLNCRGYKMKHAQLSLLTIALSAVFSCVAYAQNQSQTANRVQWTDNHHTQMAAENVRKINAQMVSGSLNVPDDLQINQSYDLNNNAEVLSNLSGSLNNQEIATPTVSARNDGVDISGSLKTDIWQIDNSYALENNHFSGSLNNIFQQDKETVLWAENNVTETKTDAVSGSLNDKEIATTATQARNDGVLTAFDEIAAYNAKITQIKGQRETLLLQIEKQLKAEKGTKRKKDTVIASEQGERGNLLTMENAPNNTAALNGHCETCQRQVVAISQLRRAKQTTTTTMRLPRLLRSLAMTAY